MTKTLPSPTSDEAAERFVAEADLTQYDLSAFQPHSFEFAPKSKQVNTRSPKRCSKRSRPRPQRKG